MNAPTPILQSLTDQELAGLHAQFVVPVAVSRILNRAEPLDDVAEYMMHDMLGAMKPDTALLALALCAQHVAAHTNHLPLGRLLGLEADEIVEEYGPLWLAHEGGGQRTGKTLDDKMVGAALAQTPEHLESLGDLLLTICGELDETHAITAILCEILGQESHMHKDEAEELLDSLFIPGRKPDRDNVVRFPTNNRLGA